MTENMNDKLSIKNILFTRAKANYIAPVPGTGYKIYNCTDCGDRFIFESSYLDHVNRKSLKITYMCRHCNLVRCFMNRCNLLSHIRSHAFRTATINVSDLKIEPLPLSEYKVPVVLPPPTPPAPPVVAPPVRTSKVNFCIDCQKQIPGPGNTYKDRALHYGEKSDDSEKHQCSICQYVLANKCALKTHLRIHLNESPWFCSDCGLMLSKKHVKYPYSHFCPGFKMMRAATRLKCPINGCNLFHPSEYKEHVKTHIKKVYKCSSCIVACFNKEAIEKHLKKHPGNQKAVVFFQCLMCPGRLVLQHQLNNHLKGHDSENYVYPCWACGEYFMTPLKVIEHKSQNKCNRTSPSTSDGNKQGSGENDNTSFRVVKRCDQCKRGFTYTCKFNEIEDLPAECPFGCIPSDKCLNAADKERPSDKCKEIVCNLCDDDKRIDEDWKAIKDHYKKFHIDHKCVDVVIKLTRLSEPEVYGRKNAEGSAAKKRKIENKNNEPSAESEDILCTKCNKKFNNKSMFEEHMITHRDPCTAYQCLECGDCYVVKPSFSKHLRIEHGITDVENYVKAKAQCYNEDALERYQKVSENTEPIKENQCSICREQFENHDDLDKHFRVHGMAFLMKNTLKKKSP